MTAFPRYKRRDLTSVLMNTKGSVKPILVPLDPRMVDACAACLARSGFNTTPALKSALAVFEYLRKDIRIFSKTAGSSHRLPDRYLYNTLK